MITANYRTHKENQNAFRLSLLDDQVIKLRRPRFDAILAQLRCDNSEHSDFENVITVNVSPTDCFLVEKVCCAGFEETIINALAETCAQHLPCDKHISA